MRRQGIVKLKLQKLAPERRNAFTFRLNKFDLIHRLVEAELQGDIKRGSSR
jgi:hypothetical protein